MSTTPRTDAAINASVGERGVYEELDRMTLLARTLEHECNRLREERSKFDAAHDWDAAMRENERLREVLTEADEALTEMGWHTDRGLLQRIRAALGDVAH